MVAGRRAGARRGEGLEGGRDGDHEGCWADRFSATHPSVEHTAYVISDVASRGGASWGAEQAHIGIKYNTMLAGLTDWLTD